MNQRVLKLNPTVSVLVLFSLLYWTAALVKPYHVDEFYSWVYARKCSFGDILRLRDGGIGHPPLYHLIQKCVQSLVPAGFVPAARLANYVFGCGFCLVMRRVLPGAGGVPLLVYGVCASAGVLETFLFSRMYGLVSLLSLLLIATGERYLRENRAILLLGAVMVFVAGMCSDYSYILVLPYLLLICMPAQPWTGRVIRWGGMLQVIVCVAVHWVASVRQGAGGGHAVYVLARSVVELCFHGWLRLCTFFFEEPCFAAAAVVAGVHVYVRVKARLRVPRQAPTTLTADVIMCGICALIAVYGLANHHPEKIVYVVPIVGGTLYVLFRQRAFFSQADVVDRSVRFVLSIGSGVLLLLTVNPIFWRNLVDRRFLGVLLPFGVLLAARHLPAATQRALGAVLLCSGVLYLCSNGLSNYFPPTVVCGGGHIVFQDEMAYADHYFRCATDETTALYITDRSKFQKFCRVCEMGTNVVPYEDFEALRFICRHDFDPGVLLPDNFIQVDSQPLLTGFDRRLFSWLTPVGTTHFTLFTYRREGGYGRP